MGLTATFFLAIVFVAVIIFKAAAANRRAKQKAEEAKAATEKRAAMETELRRRLSRLKDRDDLSALTDEIDQDAARVAKTVGKVMKSRK